jgi:hypothetical protein
MRAMTILRRILTPLLGQVHGKRLEAVLKVVEGLLVGNKLTSSALGRATPGASKARHKIKRVQRLLGNEKLLEREHPTFCMAIASVLLRHNAQPVLLVDVSELDKEYATLSAALPIDGRSVTIYAEVHSKKRVDSRKVREGFLQMLHERVVPKHCRAIVVTDSNFKNPWFAHVQRLGWDFIGRRDQRLRLQRISGEHSEPLKRGLWTQAKELYSCATTKAQDLGEWFVARQNPLHARLVLYKGPRRGRHGWRHPRRRGTHPSSAVYKKYRARAHEPWLLFTSLRCSPKRIVRCFSARMLIEENYRDFKSHRFGWALEDARASSAARWQCLLLFAMLAALAPLLFGLLGEERGLQRDYQSSGSTKRRQLSLFTLGRMLISDALRFSLAQATAAFDSLRLLIASHSPRPEELLPAPSPALPGATGT